MEELGYGPNGGLVYCMECVFDTTAHHCILLSEID